MGSVCVLVEVGCLRRIFPVLVAKEVGEGAVETVVCLKACCPST
ncbi:MAG: hypothetical protein WHS82_03495 [Candidatus Methanosuratincola sp.]